MFLVLSWIKKHFSFLRICWKLFFIRTLRWKYLSMFNNGWEICTQIKMTTSLKKIYIIQTEMEFNLLGGSWVKEIFTMFSIIRSGSHLGYYRSDGIVFDNDHSNKINPTIQIKFYLTNPEISFIHEESTICLIKSYIDFFFL